MWDTGQLVKRCENAWVPEACEITAKVDDLIQTNPIYYNLDNLYGCRELGRAWLLKLLELLPYVNDNLGKALQAMLAVNQAGNVIINGPRFLEVVSRDDLVISEG